MSPLRQTLPLPRRISRTCRLCGRAWETYSSCTYTTQARLNLCGDYYEHIREDALGY